MIPIFFLLGTKTKPPYWSKHSKQKIMDNISAKVLAVEVPVSGTTGPNGVTVRTVRDIKKLVNSGVNFDTYQIREGEILRFASFKDMMNPDLKLVQERQVSKGSQNYFTIVKCESEYKGHKKVTWFSLPSLKRQDVNNKPVNPTWYDLGNDYNRLKALGALGEIRGNHEIEIDVVKEFVTDEAGRQRPKQIRVTNEDGTPKLENGKEVWVTDTRKAHPVVISEVPADFELPADEAEAPQA